MLKDACRHAGCEELPILNAIILLGKLPGVIAGKRLANALSNALEAPASNHVWYLPVSLIFQVLDPKLLISTASNNYPSI